jgi:hypothetical protein
MGSETIKRHRVWLVSIIVTVLIGVTWGDAAAKIPEPDNIIYGIAGAGVATVTLEVNGQRIASYSMGENPDAGGFYILRIPLDSLDPPEPGSTRPGDDAMLFTDDETTPAATVTIGERGSVQKVHLTDEDMDGDGLHDGEEAYLGTNPSNVDTDGDGVADVDEVEAYRTEPLFGDTDQDGYSDGHEIAAGTNPLDEADEPVIYVNVGNTSGIELGSALYPYPTIGQGISASPEKYVVRVASGTYTEAVVIDKNIMLVGDSPTSTVIDADDAYAIDCNYTPGLDEMVSVERFTIRNADTGIWCRTGTSPLIRNNVITGMLDFGIVCDSLSSAAIVNNTISGNASATAIKSRSAGNSILNNIISDNDAGIDCDVEGVRIDYNTLWNNFIGDYSGYALPGTHDLITSPSFVAGNDFHLRPDSLCIDAGDPVEILTADYTAGSTLAVDETTALAPGDRIWISDGSNRETDIIAGYTATSIDIPGAFMNPYAVADGSYIYTATSDASNEPEIGIFRVDMGAYGNTGEAGPTTVVCDGDFDGDNDVDGSDLAELTGRSDLLDLLPVFASQLGMTGCE